MPRNPEDFAAGAGKAPKPKQPVFDARDPQNFRLGVARTVAVARTAPDHIVEEGRNWYPEVRDAVRRQAPGAGITPWQGAGIVAAVSPGMDFENHNINALDELRGIKKEHWDAIAASHAAGGSRHPDVLPMLREVAPSLTRATDGGLMKVHAILHGADVDEVLHPKTSPKTNSFAHNIHDPKSEHVTIDGRQADIVANRMRGWEQGRGLGSGYGVRGQTNYQAHVAVTHQAASVLRQSDSRFKGISPMDTQAVTWVHGKEIERSGTTKAGKPRKQGPPRTGQPYIHE